MGLASLRSLDSVGADPLNSRDPVVRHLLEVTLHPTATFIADQRVPLPARLTQDEVVKLTVRGALTARGVTRQVAASIRTESRPSYLIAAG